MVFNATNITRTNMSLPHRPVPNYIPTGGHQFAASNTNDLGFVAGRLIREIFDGLWNMIWAPPTVDHAKQRRYEIYQSGLTECVQQLNSALANLFMNSNDQSALKRVERLVENYAEYLEPAQEIDLRDLQRKNFKPIEERITRVASDRIKQVLSQLLPLFFQGKNQAPQEFSKAKRSSQQTNEFEPSLDLMKINGTNGVVVEGLALDATLGYINNMVADLNNDGFSDPVLASPLASPHGLSQAGSIFVLHGQSEGWSSPINTATLNASTGFTVNGFAANDNLARSASAGDLDGNGEADLLLGAPKASPGGAAQAGSVFVIYKQPAGWPTSIDLATLNATTLFKIDGLEAGGNLGWSTLIGDFNGDGRKDIVFSAPLASPGGRSQAGSVWVLYGQKGGWILPFNPAALNATTGFTVNGLNARDHLGWSMAKGDFNNDNIDDLCAGAPSWSSGGGVFCLYGQPEGQPMAFDLAALNATTGFILNGQVESEDFGWSIGTGDINGDGNTDIVVGAPKDDSSAINLAGAAYFFCGQVGGTPTLCSVQQGIKSDGQLGYSICTEVDLNYDGIKDVVLGAPYAKGSLLDVGEAYVCFQGASSCNLATLNGTDGFKIPGIIKYGYLGSSIGPAGDLNHDGIDDLRLGVLPDKEYIIYGKNTGNFTAPTTSPAPSITPPAPPTTPPAPSITPPAPSITPPAPSTSPIHTDSSPVVITMKIPVQLNDTYVPLTANILFASNNTAIIRLIDEKGYKVVFTGNHSNVPLFTNFTLAEVYSNFSIALGKGVISMPPVFEGCTIDSKCNTSHAENLSQLFEIPGIDWRISGSVLGVVFLAAVGGGFTFYCVYYKKLRERRIQMYRDRER